MTKPNARTITPSRRTPSRRTLSRRDILGTAASLTLALVVAPDPQARETMRVTGLDRTLLVFPTVADFHAWNRGSGSQPDSGGILTCG